MPTERTLPSMPFDRWDGAFHIDGHSVFLSRSAVSGEECLDRVIVPSEERLRRVLRGCFRYYHDWRTHLSVDMDCPEPRDI
jgi:putative transposase